MHTLKSDVKRDIVSMTSLDVYTKIRALYGDMLCAELVKRLNAEYSALQSPSNTKLRINEILSRVLDIDISIGSNIQEKLLKRLEKGSQ